VGEPARAPAPFTFVISVESAVERALAATREDKDVLVMGGATIARQVPYDRPAGRAAHPPVPILLGSGCHLFGELGLSVERRPARASESPAVTNQRFRTAIG